MPGKSGAAGSLATPNLESYDSPDAKVKARSAGKWWPANSLAKLRFGLPGSCRGKEASSPHNSASALVLRRNVPFLLPPNSFLIMKQTPLFLLLLLLSAALGRGYVRPGPTNRRGRAGPPPLARRRPGAGNAGFGRRASRGAKAKPTGDGRQRPAAGWPNQRLPDFPSHQDFAR